ncbi:MAG: late competence development ComFB family protein [Oscillospiraceae bacterium]|nr:late competence development ComFB family protein [Oscillospiraceae bacterium]
MKQLRNFTEEAITNFVEKEFPAADICQCESCRLDVMALMLNEFRPNYVVTEKGALFAQVDKDFDPQHKIDMLSSMASAVQTVKNRPRH